MFRELSGLIVVLTREHGDNDEHGERLRGWAAEVVEMPCIRVEPLADTRELADAVATLGPRDWLVLTSRHAADAVAPFVTPAVRVAVVGAATESRVRMHGLAVAFRPSRANAERLALELPTTDGVALLARAERAVRELPDMLRERGFAVHEVIAYRTVAAASGEVARVRELLAAGAPVAVIFHSPSAIEGFLGAIEAPLLAHVPVIVSGRTTMRAARDRLGPHAQIDLIDDREVSRVLHA